MIKLKENEIKGNVIIEQVEFQKALYYSVEDVSVYLKEDLSDVESINLLDKKFATLEQINAGRKREDLSEFNKLLLKAKHFNPKK